MTASEIQARILSRSDDDPGAPLSATEDEVLRAINEGQELAAFLTLCLETKASYTLTSLTAFSSIRAAFPNYLCLLRMSVGGTRVRPSTLAELDAWNDGWQSSVGTPQRYWTGGFNFLTITPQPIDDTVAEFIYARSPAPMVGDDFPEIPEAFHQSLVHYGKYRIRLKEGAQGLQRAVGDLNLFLDDMTLLAEYTRARGKAARYDVLPIEVALFDRSSLIQPQK